MRDTPLQKRPISHVATRNGSSKFASMCTHNKRRLRLKQRVQQENPNRIHMSIDQTARTHLDINKIASAKTKKRFCQNFTPMQNSNLAKRYETTPRQRVNTLRHSCLTQLYIFAQIVSRNNPGIAVQGSIVSDGSKR